jgi:hypothetical protein
MLVLSSAALGGIAVALWNRKALSTFRDLQVQDQHHEPRELTAEEENEFF